MCTVALAFRVYSGLPLILAANRDEKLDRPAEPMRVRQLEHGLVLTPLDRLAGGTWLGVNRHGLVVAVTNRFGHDRDPARRSRGLLVMDALGAPSAEAAARMVAAMDPKTVNPFHLFLADGPGARAPRAFLAVHEERSDFGAQISELAPGWHVLTERSHMGAPPLREQKVRRRLASMKEPPPASALKDLLSSHEDAPLDATCVHLPEWTYGTRATTLYFGADDPAGRRLYTAEGPACQSTLSDRSALLAELAAAGQSR